MPQCSATSKQSGARCKRPASEGYQVCYVHGARGGAPAGNKNAVTTGEYETIWLDQLDDDERLLFPRVNPDALAQLDEEIRLTTIRERRMLARIRDLDSTDFTVVEKHVERKQGVDAGDDDEDNTGSVDVTTTKIVEHGTLGQIQDIEHALTRVQQLKTRLIELRHRMAAGDDADDAMLGLVAAIARSREVIARTQQGDNGTEVTGV